MWKALIVDEETNGSQKIKNYLEKFDLGIEVVGATSDGHTAMKIARDEKPDVVLADIYIPALRGLNFVDAMHDCLPDSLVVVTTGFRDFEYVQRALRLKVFDYLLKPVSSRQLYETCRKAFFELKKNTPQKEFLAWIKQHLGSNFSFIMEQLLDELIDEKPVKNIFFQLLNYLGVDILSHAGIMVTTSLEISETASTTLQASRMDLFENQIEKELSRFPPCVTFQYKKKYIISLFSAEKTAVKTAENCIVASLGKRWGNTAIVRTAYISDIQNDLTGTFAALINDVEHTDRFSPLVAHIKHYIEQHYHRADISLRDVSEEFNVSVSYIGRLLRKELDCSFVSYLTRIRIEQAMKLLEDPSLKIRQIAEYVGYEGQHYFSNLFKKTVGVPPGEYRRTLLGDT